MENAITRDEIKSRLANLYRGIYDNWYQLMNEAKAAADDDDEDAHKAITRRADKKSDFMDGIKSAAEALGIGFDEFMDAVNVGRHSDSDESWTVITPTGLDVFTGSKPDCNDFIENALRRGSQPGFLRIITTQEWESGATNE